MFFTKWELTASLTEKGKWIIPENVKQESSSYAAVQIVNKHRAEYDEYYKKVEKEMLKIFIKEVRVTGGDLKLEYFEGYDKNDRE